MFGRLLDEIPNMTVIDVGIWKGQSTLFIAELMRQRRIDGCIIAVDTFLATEHWPARGILFERHHGGRPDVYETFLENVFYAGETELVVPLDEARFVLCTGHDVMPGTDIPYTTNLSLARAVENDVLLVHTWEGQPLPREHGGPCRMITPKLYAWKGTKWIRKIEFLADDRKGFWEVRGYSNSAEPWFNDRYSTE